MALAMDQTGAWLSMAYRPRPEYSHHGAVFVTLMLGLEFATARARTSPVIQGAVQPRRMGCGCMAIVGEIQSRRR